MHLAAEGGSLPLLRWLVDELGCPLYDEEDRPLCTQPRGDSVLGVAARHRHAHVMRWLVAAKQCKVSEIADRAQLVAAVEFLLLGEDGYGHAPRRSRRLLPTSGEGYEAGEVGEEVKQHEAYDYASGGEDAWVQQRLRQGKKKGKGTSKAKAGRKPPDGAGSVVDECLVCGVRRANLTFMVCVRRPPKRGF